MPVRVALNVAYALLMEGRDKKERDEIDAKLYGWGEMNEAAERDLWQSGGEG